MFKECNWNKYHIAPTTRGVDSIIDYSLIDNPDFSDLDTLTKQIERGILRTSYLNIKIGNLSTVLDRMYL
ncbi:DUF7000 family protein [Chloroflexota bacterium]